LLGIWSVAALGLGGLALLCGVWIVVPAPHRALSFLAVGASELSAWLLLGAAAGIGLGIVIVTRALGGDVAPVWAPWVAGLAIGCGVPAVGLALVPPWLARPVAAESRVALSPLRALVGPFAGAPARSSVDVTTVVYATPNGQPQRMDVYRPAGLSDDDRSRLRSGVIVVHGGAWDGGARSERPQWNRWLVARGHVVFDVDYRLAPQPNWELATGDVLCAVGTIRERAAEWGVDPGRLALLGRSAGGQLALLAAYGSHTARTPTAPIVPVSCAVPDTSVRAVISLYGPTDLLWGYEHSANQKVINGRRVLGRFVGGTPQSAPEVYARASPITHVRAGLPPTLMLHGRRDQFAGVQHSERLAARLEGAGVAHEVVLLPHAQHGFDYVFGGWGGQIAQGVIARFLETHLG
jgi:acetyl esterase/lipase